MCEIQSNILKLLSKKSSISGLTINQIATNISIERHTATKNLEVLKSRGLIDYKEVGKSKIWTRTGNSLIKVLENHEINSIANNFKDILGYIEEDINIQSRDLNTIWSNRNINSKKCFEREGMTEKCKNCPIEKTFLTGKSETSIITMNNRKIEIVTKPIKDDNNNIIAVVEIIKKRSHGNIKRTIRSL